MSGVLLLQNRLLSLNSVALARFVTDITLPQRQYHDTFPPTELESTTQRYANIEEGIEKIVNQTNGLHLTQLLHLYRERPKAESAHVAATASVTYELSQWETVFENACGDVETRRWMEKAIEDDKRIYFIVGYRTFVHPSIKDSRQLSHAKGIDFELPASTVIQANVPGLALGNALDPGISHERGETNSASRSFSVDKEVVYAIQYCKVAFKWWSSKSIEKSSLGKTKWKIHWGVRSVVDVDDEDILEARIDEEAVSAEDCQDDQL